MKPEELRSQQAPLKERYRAEPQAAAITLKAQARLDEGITCRVETGKALVSAGLHPATGGDGLSVCSGDMLLEAAGGMRRGHDERRGHRARIEIRSGRVRTEGDLDFRGTLGVSKETPVGFQRIRVFFDLDTDASEEQLATLVEADRALLRRLSDL
jgi:hypothetical protein